MEPESGAPPPDETEETHERLVLPLLLPVGVFLFAALVIYGLSRIYLEISSVEIGDVNLATPLALGVALGILGVAWYFASHPRAPRWQVAFTGLAAVALLTGGGIFAAVHEEEEADETVVVDGVTPTPGVSPPLLVEMQDNFFVFQDEREPTIEVTAGQEVTISLVNNGRATHNLHIDGTDGVYPVDFCETGGDQPCSDPEAMQGSDTGTITFQFDQPGTYRFRCDFHPTEMVGSIRVVEAEEDSTPASGVSPPPGELLVEMEDNFFVFQDEREPAIEVAAGQEITINLRNNGQAVHNMHIDGTDDTYGVDFCEVGGGEVCSDPEFFQSGDTGTITFQFDQPGTYLFRCDFHPSEMVGAIRVVD